MGKDSPRVTAVARSQAILNSFHICLLQEDHRASRENGLVRVLNKDKTFLQTDDSKSLLRGRWSGVSGSSPQVGQELLSTFGFPRKFSLAGLAPIEAVLFDIDGTLCDSDPIHYYAFREMLQEIGFNNGVPITEDFFIENISGKHNEEIGEILFPDWDHEKATKFMDDKEAMFRRLASQQLKPVDGLHKLCKWIEERGFKRAAVTNAPRPNAELMISLLGLSDFFQLLVLGSECERAKPFPDPYLKALKELKASPDHTFVFEDSASGIKAGVAAGMPVIGLTTRNPEKLLMEAGAICLIKDYEDPKLWMALEELDNMVKKAAL